MWDRLPDPFSVYHQLECPECHTRFKLSENYQVGQNLTCPGCGKSHSLLECISEEAMLNELTLARKKMQKAWFCTEKKTPG
jgi:PHP family Zn ribbon phosphoesterase